MSFKKNLEKLKELDHNLSAINYAQAMISWDAMTLAPKKSVKGRSAALEGLSGYYFKTLISKETEELLLSLEAVKEQLSEIELAKIAVLRDDYDKIARIPAKEYAAYSALIAESSVAWEIAKENNQFHTFLPFLEKVIQYNKNYIDYRGKNGNPYSTLLDDYEKHLTVETADQFFGYLQKSIVPLVKHIQTCPQVKLDFKGEHFTVPEQAKFSKFIMEQLGFRMDCGVLAESVHPFTMNLFRDDVRITTRYFEEDFKSALLSTIHETGHAIYEQNIDEAFGLSILATGTSMGIHESQSRIFENNFGRSYAFWECYFEKLKKAFPSPLNKLDLDTFYKGINFVEPSFIRIEADEVTYPLHIMIRYEIEKMIFNNKVQTKELPELWRAKYKEYLGITPETDDIGVLQDVHWSEGMFGYFPSYALGSAYAAQIKHTMDGVFSVEEKLRKGDFTQIVSWLGQEIHRFGRSKTPDQILLSATGEVFNPKYFVDYLTQKFSQMYV
ncbi:MAG: carboxypeptidase M32 [Vallitaleaceae bacterium]|nr:carboxypeptidase M32 [Vallitaleaceae bacterium]